MTGPTSVLDAPIGQIRDAYAAAGAALATAQQTIAAQAAQIKTLTPVTRRMYDCAPEHIGLIPVDADIILRGPAWTDANAAAAKARCPSAVIAWLIHNMTQWVAGRADVIDIEKGVGGGYATLAEAMADVPKFLDAQKSIGLVGTPYCWEGNLATLRVAAAGRMFLQFDADQDGNEHRFSPVSVATQWRGAKQGALIDTSTVYDPNWLVSYR